MQVALVLSEEMQNTLPDGITIANRFGDVSIIQEADHPKDMYYDNPKSSAVTNKLSKTG